jgi:hypothetical protein
VDACVHNVARHSLIPQFRGVYTVGHEALTFRARCIAALLAVGDDAALSHEAAAHLWALLSAQPPFIDVTTSDRRPRSRRGLTTHQAPVSVTRKDGLLITTPEQTLHDLRRHPRVEAMTSEGLTWRQVMEEPMVVVARLAAVLARSAAA